MISVEKCLYKLDQRLNNLSTFANQSIPVEDKLLVLNEAQVEVVLSKVDVNNLYHIGMDGFRKRYQDLQVLVQPHEEIDAVKGTLDNTYTSALKDLKKQYLLYTDIFITADKGACKGATIAVNVVKHSDITASLNNSNLRPSFEWQETIATLSSDSLQVYTDGTFTPVKAYISYLTYPTEFDYEGYTHLDGEASITQDSNLPDYLENEVIAVAVRILAGSTGNIGALQVSQIDRKENE